jgi:hypothetical protein
LGSRLTDNDKNTKFVGLNRPITIADLLADLDRAAPLPQQVQALQPEDQQAVMIGLQLPPGDPRLQTIVRIENDIGDMDVDITVEEGPDNPTLQAEQFQMLTQLPQAVVAQIPPDIWIKASSLRNKDELLKMLEEHAKANAAAAAQKHQIDLAMAQATVADKQASAADKQASAAQKVHDIAVDHASAIHTPVVPGIGPVEPEINPLLQGAPQPQGATPQ